MFILLDSVSFDKIYATIANYQLLTLICEINLHWNICVAYVIIMLLDYKQIFNSETHIHLY